MSENPFRKLGLSAPLVQAVTASGYTTPTRIQEQAIPAVLSGKDILAAAQTGTGKTAAFILPLLEKLVRGKKRGRHPAALILTPTRELAAQVLEDTKTYAKFTDVRSTAVFGGVNIRPQIKKLANGVDILVATPGRLLDLMGQSAVSLREIETIVLDEADRMLDMGFIPDIRRILKKLPEKRRSLLFSATYSGEIRKLAATMLVDPMRIEVRPEETAAKTVSQRAYAVARPEKAPTLARMIRESNWPQVLVFTRTKRGANSLAQKLDREGIKSTAIHGNKSQGARTKALSCFKAGAVQVLVATDIAARGLDIDSLPQVVNFDLPHVPEDYVHRIGRTGRAGQAGSAASFVSPDEVPLWRAIERVLKRKLKLETVS